MSVDNIGGTIAMSCSVTTTVTVTSPVSSDGTAITIVRGDDYLLTDSSINPRPASKGTETKGGAESGRMAGGASIHDPHRRVLKLIHAQHSQTRKH